MQILPSVKEQYQLYSNEIVPKKNIEVHYCSVDSEVAKELQNQKEFLAKDNAERLKEVKELKEQFDLMNEKMVDIMAWNRKVIATATHRQQRQHM